MVALPVSAAFTGGAVIASSVTSPPGSSANQYLILAGILVTFLTAILGYVRTQRKLADIHVLVNSQLSSVLEKLSVSIARQDQLHSTLINAGVDVPPKPVAEKGIDGTRDA